MRLLIFGATGVVGAWAARKALEHGHDVTVYVRNKVRLAEDILSSDKVKVLLSTLTNLLQAARISRESQHYLTKAENRS